MVAIAKVDDVQVQYGSAILHGSIIEVHSNWFMIKVQAVTDSNGAKIPDAWMIGRYYPAAISDQVWIEDTRKITTANHPAV